MNKILDVNHPAILPPNPQFWGNWSSKSPRIGGFRGRSQIRAGGLLFWLRGNLQLDSAPVDRHLLIVKFARRSRP